MESLKKDLSLEKIEIKIKMIHDWLNNHKVQKPIGVISPIEW